MKESGDGEENSVSQSRVPFHGNGLNIGFSKEERGEMDWCGSTPFQGRTEQLQKRIDKNAMMDRARVSISDPILSQESERVSERVSERRGMPPLFAL